MKTKKWKRINKNEKMKNKKWKRKEICLYFYFFHLFVYLFSVFFSFFIVFSHFPFFHLNSFFLFSFFSFWIFGLYFDFTKLFWWKSMFDRKNVLKLVIAPLLVFQTSSRYRTTVHFRNSDLSLLNRKRLAELKKIISVTYNMCILIP